METGSFVSEAQGGQAIDHGPARGGLVSGEDLDAVMAPHLPHPFERALVHDNAERVARRFLALSLGFPYAQAGAQSRCLDDMVRENRPASPLVEVTSVVGNFLVWDETGGHGSVLESGNAGLPDILETGRFHGNLCRRDLSRIFGKEMDPDFDVSGPYLLELRELFASDSPITRCAAMVSFERHAEIVIGALWERLRALFPSEVRTTLPYFETHVGGDDPAEFYHVQMTQGMVDRVVRTKQDAEQFLDAFEDTFALHVRWSSDICA